MKKWLVIAVLVAIAAPVLGARQTVVRTDPFGTGWTKQNNMNTELYQKTDPTETGFTGMDGAVITSGVVPSAKSLSPDKVSGVPSINFLYEANGTDTNGVGFLGPENSTKNILYRISDESPTVGQILKISAIDTDQTVAVGSGSIVADIVTLLLADESGASGFTTFPAYKDSPGTKGQYAVDDAGTLLAMCVGTNSWRTVALSDTLSLTPTTPTLVSLTIPAAGTTAEAVFSEAMAIGAGGAGGWTLNDPTVAMTRTGGIGTVEDPVIFSLARTVLSTATENPYASYTQPTNGFESADDGVDIASITNASVTNNSTQTGVDYSDILFYWGAENSGVANKPASLTPTTSTLAYQTSPKLAGSYSAAYNSATYNRVQWPNTADAVFDRTNGRAFGWITTGSTIVDNRQYFEATYDASNYVRLRNYNTTGLEVLWVGGGVTHQAYVATGITTNTPYFVEFSWGAGGVKMYIDGVEQTLAKSGTFTAMSSTPVDGSISIGGSPSVGGIAEGASFDQWFISNDMNRDGYAIQTETNPE